MSAEGPSRGFENRTVGTGPGEGHGPEEARVAGDLGPGEADNLPRRCLVGERFEPREEGATAWRPASVKAGDISTGKRSAGAQSTAGACGEGPGLWLGSDPYRRAA